MVPNGCAVGVQVGGELDGLSEDGAGAVGSAVRQVDPLLPESDGEGSQVHHNEGPDDEASDDPGGQHEADYGKDDGHTVGRPHRLVIGPCGKLDEFGQVDAV